MEREDREGIIVGRALIGVQAIVLLWRRDAPDVALLIALIGVLGMAHWHFHWFKKKVERDMKEVFSPWIRSNLPPKEADELEISVWQCFEREDMIAEIRRAQVNREIKEIERAVNGLD